MRMFGQWITNEPWDCVFGTSSGDAMAQSLEDMFSEKYKDHFPQKTIVHRTNAKPWVNDSIRRLMSQRNIAFKIW